MRFAFLLALCLLIVPVALADDNQTSLPVYNETFHIQNGGCVPLNATVDITSLGWGVPRIVYFHRWTDGFAPDGTEIPTYTIEMPNTRSALRSYYINPAVFGNRTGYWYQNYRLNETEPSANQRMFYINLTCPAKTNKTELPVNISQTNKTIPDTLPFLPERKEADILIARGDAVTFAWDTPARFWLFGYSTGSYQYDQPAGNSQITLDTGTFKGLQPGNYHLDIIQPGKNEIFEESFNPHYRANKFNASTFEVIESPFTSKAPVYIGDLDPQSAEVQLKTFIASTIDDNLTSLRVSYQEPVIEIKRMDAVVAGDNRTWYNLRGYTNVADGTPLTVTLDPDVLNSETTSIRQWKTAAIGLRNNPGVTRQFNIQIPLDYSGIFPGPHEFMITAPNGATQRVPFYIYQELPAHYIPPQYIDYTGASPYVTPQIITNTVIKEVTVEKTVVVHDTPAPEQVQAAQDRAAWTVAFTVGGWIAVILIAFLIGRWLVSVYHRARENHV